MRLLHGLALLCWGLLGCASGPETSGETANYGIKNGQTWVRGPWDAVQPSQDVDEVIDQLCPAIMRQPRAQFGDYGREYCGLIYTLGDGSYYASHPSPLSDTQESCLFQREKLLRAPTGGGCSRPMGDPRRLPQPPMGRLVHDHEQVGSS